MSLSVKKPKTYELPSASRLTGETLIEAVTTALRERLARLEQKPDFDEASMKSSRRSRPTPASI